MLGYSIKQILLSVWLEWWLFLLKEKMDSGGAYGAGKAGGAFDPFIFVQRPQVILRAVCLVSKHI